MKKETNNDTEVEEEVEGSSAEESKETPAEETSEGVKVPEDFQMKCHELIEGCDSMPCLDYLSSAVSEKRSELYKKEQEGNKKGKKPSTYSEAEMPSMD